MIQPATVSEFSALLAQRQTSAVELVESTIEQIHNINRDWNLFSALLKNRAIEHALASDERRANNRLLGPLDGVPIALKDNLHISGCPTFAGTGYDFSHNFNETAVVASLLDKAGAIIIGKCTMDEGAMGASTNNPFSGQCRNPVYPGLTPGGSSGGSAASVAAQFVAASLGTDTMGSVRIPAAYCGLWGMKPSHGLVSTGGLVPLSPTLDCIGPLAHNAIDLKLMLAAMTGNTVFKKPPFNSPEKCRIGVISTENLSTIELAVVSAFDNLLDKLADINCTITMFKLDDWEPGRLRRDALVLTEVQASSALSEQLKDHPKSFSNAFHKMMEYGQSVKDERLSQSLGRIKTIKASTLSCLDKYDALLLPTAPQRAFTVDSEPPSNQADFAVLANVAGCPAVTFPIAVPGDTRPASAQLLGKPGTDFSLLNLAELIATLN